MSIMQTAGLVLAVVFVIMITGIILKLTGIFGGADEQGTLATQARIVSAIEALMDPSTEESTCKIVNAFIQKDFALVGFHKNSDSVEEQCGAIAILRSDVTKPPACVNSACICACDGGWGDISGNDCIGRGVVCVRLPDNVNELKTLVFNNEIFDMVLYGETCSGRNRGVVSGYIVKRLGNDILIKSLESAEDMSVYATAPDCEEMADSLEGDEADSLAGDIIEGAEQGSAAISVDR